ncbi:MAG TPA: MFS transporter [Candidatus Binatia bacterium]|jgi:MFS family permease|nr:MFS transporter [Candidatus Binatia bacterium]
MLLPIFLVVLADVFALTLVLPLLAIYAERFGATPLDATLLVSVFATCQLVSSPLLGRLSDRIGRKPVLVMSQIGTFIGLIVMAEAHTLWLLYVARIIDGATAGNLTVAQAYIADNTPPDRRARAFGLIGIAFGLGFFLGPAVTGHLSRYGLEAPIWAAAGLSMTSILCTTFLLKNQPIPTAPSDGADLPAGRRPGVLDWEAYAPYLRRPVLSGLLTQFFCFSFAFATFTSGFALFAERTFHWEGHPFTPREIGYLFAYAGFFGIILQGGLIGRLVQRFGEPRLVATGFGAMAAGYLLLGLIDQVGPLVAVATLTAFGQGVLRPTLTSLITQHVDRHDQGAVLGVSQSLGSIAQITAPPLGGFLIGTGALHTWAFVAACAAAGGLVAARWGSGSVSRTTTRPETADAAAAG